MRVLRVKNWSEFQHYKDRDPPWIKLHRNLLENYDFSSLSDVQRGHLILIWLLAARCDNRIPMDPAWIGSRIGAKQRVDVDAFVDAGFLEYTETEREADRAEGWGSRYIPDVVREAVLERDGRRCRTCDSSESLEIDHVVPVSKGGGSDAANLQVLCRSCNRRKRATLKPEPAERVATQESSLRSLEAEAEERQRRGEAEADQSSPRPPSRSAGTPIGGLEFPCDGKISAWSVTEELAARWRELFPSLDVALECKGALAWVLAKPQRRKTARGMEAFLVGWFGRSQNRGRSTAPAVTANDQRCDWHRKAPNRRSNYPRRGCPECKHFEAAGAGRTGSPEPIADALPSWMGEPPPAPITPEQRAEMQAGIAAIKKPKPQQPTGDTPCT